VLGLDRRHRHARTIHFDIKHRDLAARDIGQIELNGALDVFLLAARDITAYGFGMPFDGFACHLKPRNQHHLLAALVKNEASLPTTAIMRLTPGE
jgi:hypothetical protein